MSGSSLRGFWLQRLWHGCLLALALAVAGCGGREGDGGQMAATAPPPPTIDLLTQLAGTGISAAGAAGAATLSPDQFMDWAEGLLPALFPGHQATVAATGYVYRYYPQGNSFIAIADDGGVYVLLANTSTQLQYVGPLASFACAVPGVCSGISLLAGSTGGPGTLDGTGAAAKFLFPLGLAVDAAGNAYIADATDNTIRKMTPQGQVSTLAGTHGVAGTTDGLGTAALFNTPRGVAVDGAGNVFVADRSAVRKISPAGLVSTLAGAVFNLPTGVAVDGAGNVLVTDRFDYTVRKITSDGTLSTLAGKAGVAGAVDGQGTAAGFYSPAGIAVDAAGNAYVADGGAIRKVTPAGVVSTLAGVAGALGSADGTGAQARFKFVEYPVGLVADAAGNLYVADINNHTIRKVTPAGVVTTLAGTPGAILGSLADGVGAAARFFNPSGIGLDGAGNLLIADSANSALRKLTPAGQVTTVAGSAVVRGSDDGTGAQARFSGAQGMAVDAAGNTYVADGDNRVIRKITPAGVVSTLAGTAGVTGTSDGQGTAASFVHPWGVAVDGAGNVYVTDGSRFEFPPGGGTVSAFAHTVRKITPAGQVTTLAGSAGVAGSVDGQGTAAQFANPAGIAVDGAGNLYVADSSNCTVRKITPAGLVSTLAGTAHVCDATNGIGAGAHFAVIQGLAADAAGNVYLPDGYSIRMLTPAGVVSTLAGEPDSPGYVDGGAAAARFRSPIGVAVDAAGNVLVADTYNYLVRRITPAGNVSTVAGTPKLSGAAAASLPGTLPASTGIAMDAHGVLYVGTGTAVLKLQLP